MSSIWVFGFSPEEIESINELIRRILGWEDWDSITDMEEYDRLSRQLSNGSLESVYAVVVAPGDDLTSEAIREFHREVVKVRQAPKRRLIFLLFGHK